ncbi:MAG: TfoX/Sxy family protein [Pseudomonadota bacterium]
MSEFVAYLEEVFRQFGAVRARRMFGGHGIYRDGVMFGLVADDVLYLKADAELRIEFEALGLEAFEYNKNGQPMKMSYFLAPDEIYEDEDAAKLWATRAFEAALRTKARKRAKPRG